MKLEGSRPWQRGFAHHPNPRIYIRYKRGSPGNWALNDATSVTGSRISDFDEQGGGAVYVSSMPLTPLRFKFGRQLTWRNADVAGTIVTLASRRT
jgi:hypothetical protein